MKNPNMIDTMEIEANARALRATFVRDIFTAIAARIRNTRANTAGDAHA